MSIEKLTAFDIERYEQGEAQHIRPDDLGVVEDRLVEAYLPVYPRLHPETKDDIQDNWDTRVRLIDEIRGKLARQHFFGSLVGITITPLASPADELRASGLYKTRRHDIDQLAEHTVGFRLDAGLETTLASDPGTLQRSVWVVRAPLGKAMQHSRVLWKRYIGPDTGTNSLEYLTKASMRRGASCRGGRPRATTPVRQVLDDDQNR